MTPTVLAVPAPGTSLDVPGARQWIKAQTQVEPLEGARRLLEAYVKRLKDMHQDAAHVQRLVVDAVTRMGHVLPPVADMHTQALQGAKLGDSNLAPLPQRERDMRHQARQLAAAEAAGTLEAAVEQAAQGRQGLTVSGVVVQLRKMNSQAPQVTQAQLAFAERFTDAINRLPHPDQFPPEQVVAIPWFQERIEPALDALRSYLEDIKHLVIQGVDSDHTVGNT